MATQHSSGGGNRPEGDKEALAGVIHLFPAVSCEECSEGVVVPSD